MKAACFLWLGLALMLPAVAATDKETAAVTATLQAACRAYQTGDAAALEGLLADGFILTDSRGEITDRQQEIAGVRDGSARYTLFENRDMHVRLHGDTAVVTGRTHIETVSDGHTNHLVFQFTDTLIRRNGKWLVAASHATRITEK